MIELRTGRIAAYLVVAFLLAAFMLIGCGRRPAEPVVATPAPAQEPVDLNPAAAPPLPDYVAEGKAYMQSGDREKALVQFTKAIEAEPKDAKRYVYRAEVYNQKWQTGQAFEIYPFRSPNPAEHIGDSLTRLHQFVQIVAEDLDGDVSLHSRYQLVHSHLNRLRKLDVVTDVAIDYTADLIGYPFFGFFGAWPCFPRLQHDVTIANTGWLRIDGNLCCA